MLLLPLRDDFFRLLILCGVICLTVFPSARISIPNAILRPTAFSEFSGWRAFTNSRRQLRPLKPHSPTSGLRDDAEASTFIE
ncbi:unnamed protein product [Protopolystoma xenopodis]|uniref:Uncharacterized protein n=1 Tax=Protopolystoma xenopodis TaxID=117903 RepID=A0A3S5AMR2_9PLAT|nr:unnamed protein product [Protopolystoma xenopodis]